MSSPLVFAIFAIALISFAVFYLFYFRNWRRRKELEEPFPSVWRQTLENDVPLYSALPAALKKQLENHVQLFLAEKDFYGCDGFEISDRVRVTIAGHASLLILARPFSMYDEVRSILVYPDIYRVQAPRHDGMIVHMNEQVRAGEASSRGQVVLAWSECEEGAHNPNGPHNVILHEFAHQLDYLDGTADGAPPLSGEFAAQWQQTMSRAYESLRSSLRHHSHSWLDPYGATQPAEFFAVLTEAFFQQPGHIHKVQPDVFEALKNYYRLDPRDFKH
ncbi:zinc-dependent peptidase [Marinobacter salinexigens]|uniref:Zinc-dependent peptidase n=1 Tax=Marinobacter salinexigens TaxID=2919747 RepID=A0A5B0VCJ0_9GAMM|nr:M90 family metallopeptidase [Marinobacter salinexigens]KAA1171933.1 zinc-dependent peptidase [Marinobacter salinexigens]